MPRPLDQLGRPLHDLRISLLDRCNLRCAYCMPAAVFGPDYPFLRQAELLTFEEIVRAVRAFVRCGVSKIRLTGGEPLLRNGVAELAARLRAEPGVEDLALTTNGILLGGLAKPLQAAGVDRINISLDALDPEVFARMSGGRGQLARVLAGIEAALAAGLEVKVNMVVEAGLNEGEIEPLARWCKERRLNLRFIEFMDVGNVNQWAPEKVYPARAILRRLEVLAPLDPVEAAYRGEVAQRYRYRDDGVEIGLITSITQPFCRDCSRARLSADGKIFTCLFADQGHDLRGLLRGSPPADGPASDEDLFRAVAGVWKRRSDRYSEIRGELLGRREHPHKVEMSYIGG